MGGKHSERKEIDIPGDVYGSGTLVARADTVPGTGHLKTRVLDTVMSAG